MKKFDIYNINLGRASGIKDNGKRPIIVLEIEGDFVKVLKVTTRNKFPEYQAHLNSYLIYGYCMCTDVFTIHKSCVLNGQYVRCCTSSEKEEILSKYNNVVQQNKVNYFYNDFVEKCSTWNTYTKTKNQVGKYKRRR